MKYYFVKRYNRAYDFFLIRYFNQGGIEFDDMMTYEEVAPRWIFANSMKNKSPQERLFCDYVSNWRIHPEARPSYHEQFDRAIGGNGWPEFQRLKELESQLVAPNKLVFSTSEVAVAISEFYRRYLRDPLKAEMEAGHGGMDITKFFSAKEIEPLLRVPEATGDEERESLRNKVAGEILLLFDSITPQKIEHDLERVLEEHDSRGEHMKAPHPDVKPEQKMWFCKHKTEFVELVGYRPIGDIRPSMFLRPARGSEAPDYLIEEGWDIVAFPNYLVVEGDYA